MGIISRQYIKNFVCRYDKEVGVPYYSYEDFEGLIREQSSFKNSLGIDISYFFYYYPNYQTDKVVLLCHGLGPGHVSYLREIELLAKLGFKVLTLDYTGCGESQGKNMRSLNQPTRDAMELLDYLQLKEEIVLVGHSLGGYTSLNLLSLKDEIKKAVVLAPFISIESLLTAFLKKKFIVSRILKYEKKMEPALIKNNLFSFLEKTNKDVMFIQSDNDQMVPPSISLEKVKLIENIHIRVIEKENRKHNPNYSDDAVNYMNDVFGRFLTLQAEKKIKTDEDKIAFFKDVSLERLTNQDLDLFKEITAFINN